MATCKQQIQARDRCDDAQRAHGVSYRPIRVSLEPPIFLSSLCSDYAEGPGRFRTFPASWYTTTIPKIKKKMVREVWATFFEKYFGVGAPVFMFPAGWSGSGTVLALVKIQ